MSKNTQLGNLVNGVFVNAAGNSVGMGTQTPRASLDVTGNIHARQGCWTTDESLNGGFLIGDLATGTAYTYIGGVGSTGAASYLSLSTNAGEKMRITSAGNVGIGTSSPSAPLHVFSSSSVTAVFTRDLTTDVSLRILSDNSGAILDTQGVHSLRFQTSDTERMRITSAGKVGINNNAPTAKFEVLSGYDPAGFFKCTNNEVPLSVINTENAVASIGFRGSTSSNEYNVRCGANGENLVLYTNNSERMRINSDGTLILGGTSSSGTAGTGTGRGNLLLAGSISNTISFNNNSTSVNGTIYSDSAEMAIISNTFLEFRTAGIPRMRIFSSGNVRFSSQVYGNTVASPRTLFIASDGELGGISSIRESKTNIKAIDSNWLMQLNPVSFNYRKKDNDGIYTNEYFDELFYGLIAEETELINKEICTYTDGKLVGIEYSKLVPVLVKAIQELKAEIEILKQK